MGTKKPLGIQVTIIFVILLGACGPDYNEELIDFVIFNESGLDIMINSNPSIGEQFPITERPPLMIENNDTFSEVMKISTRNASFSFQTFFGTNNIEIVYGNQRKAFFSCVSSDGNNNCSNARNILKFGPDSNNRAEYTFTISDFDSAEPFDGPCYD